MGCTVKCKISNKNPSDQLHGWQRTITNEYPSIFFFYSLIKSINRNKDRLIESNSNSIENETWKVNVFLIFKIIVRNDEKRTVQSWKISFTKKKERKKKSKTKVKFKRDARSGISTLAIYMNTRSYNPVNEKGMHIPFGIYYSYGKMHCPL